MTKLYKMADIKDAVINSIDASENAKILADVLDKLDEVAVSKYVKCLTESDMQACIDNTIMDGNIEYAAYIALLKNECEL